MSVPSRPEAHSVERATRRAHSHTSADLPRQRALRLVALATSTAHTPTPLPHSPPPRPPATPPPPPRASPTSSSRSPSRRGPRSIRALRLELRVLPPALRTHTQLANVVPAPHASP